MNKVNRKKVIFLTTLLMGIFCSVPSVSATQGNAMSNTISDPVVTPEIYEKAKANNNWKLAYLTGKHAQVVFMNVSPGTNPNNEIGMETHAFDQIILVAQGSGKAILNGKESVLKSGDMIFIPQGTAHNVINSNPKESLKIISIYSDTDIPANSVYKKKSDEAQD